MKVFFTIPERSTSFQTELFTYDITTELKMQYFVFCSHFLQTQEVISRLCLPLGLIR